MTRSRAAIHYHFNTPHAGKSFLNLVESHLKSDCIYHFPFDLVQNGAPFSSKLIWIIGKYNLISVWFNAFPKRFLSVCLGEGVGRGNPRQTLDRFQRDKLLSSLKLARNDLRIIPPCPLERAWSTCDETTLDDALMPPNAPEKSFRIFFSKSYLINPK